LGLILVDVDYRNVTKDPNFLTLLNLGLVMFNVYRYLVPLGIPRVLKSFIPPDAGAHPIEDGGRTFAYILKPDFGHVAYHELTSLNESSIQTEKALMNGFGDTPVVFVITNEKRPDWQTEAEDYIRKKK